ncbi:MULTISPECIES: MaoC/PaaZ C-terminal domain-containing protein [unclassified Rhodococcus (in: high G+C Gram-positive bacteria)]|uniref:MaoC/PaaZ C-terminal domain-containing protein n=1 Tax=unclassified Rhodococcus (in: high G+C Gram-positive bacteria) TaxID=192944 RepID=UPI00163A1ADB|nr:MULTISPECIES: MaoC/PaaZ C-terminal domain-containing protein [unclassified Rhodococcus (in: high G+C Gram-positive bacteria)]MBC2644534.1 MaoC family dehydratase N-terminal domain-containing protein [Rhodococcus sp. 3A]MBC2897777.1 MaoC family dehydratase N-terminal domain-containing protein [Rhodococcus sp. 4CII]
MTARPTLAVAVGDVVAKATHTITRDSLVRYAGASGDFNPIHYRDDVAAAAGLPGVLAPGMLTAGLALQPVIDWRGDATRILSYETRFTRPVVVDPHIGAAVDIIATVAHLDPGAATARIDLTVRCKGRAVLGKTRVVVDLAR